MSIFSKITVALVIFCMYAGIGHYYLTSNSVGGSVRALNLFQEGNYLLAGAFVEEMEKTSPLPHYSLYQAYIARAGKDFDLMDSSLRMALKRSEIENISTLLNEIHLNHVFNAYMRNHVVDFEKALSAAKEVKGVDHNWIHLFSGLSAFMKGHYEEASAQWESLPQLSSLSPWMKESIGAHFTQAWVDAHLARCFIEKGQFVAARLKLEQAMKKATAQDLVLINYMIGFSYYKEASLKPRDKAGPYYELATSHLESIDDKAKFFADWPALFDFEKMSFDQQA